MDFLQQLAIGKTNSGTAVGGCWLGAETDETLTVSSPVDGAAIARVRLTAESDYDRVVQRAREAFALWRDTPAPRRGEVVRRIGLRIREHKKALGTLISYEMGKSLQEGLGEVQEMIDMADFAVGQSRMLHGSTMPSERPRHRLFEQYHPLGAVGVITAFNFPLAVWAWNAMLGAVCGNVMIWKPSSKVPLTAIAAQKIVAEVLRDSGAPEGVFSLVTGRGGGIGEKMVHDGRLPLISFTGSIATGRRIAVGVAGRFGRTILELGGNNAIILTEHTDLKLAVPAVVFGAVGTAGQRCTTTRRLIVRDRIYDRVREALLRAYEGLKIGNPLEPGNHMGPLIDSRAVEAHCRALDLAVAQGGRLIYGGGKLSGGKYASGCYVVPAIVEARNDMAIVREETFAPILYLIRYQGEVSTAVAIQNDVRQGLSSAIFTTDMREAEMFLSAAGSDCGIANVNIGTSGAEIGGAFGGEKETGGGREAGSDAWKAYMRRQTVTVNYGEELPLAQGVRFDLQGGGAS